ITYANGKEEKKRHTRQCIDFLKEAIVASQGGALILCSSHEQVDELYKGLLDHLSSKNIWLLRQSKHQSITSVVRDFANDINSVLIGTASLWQGVDVPGPALRSLFIYKIPYRMFTEPLIKARRDEIDREGGDSFSTYYEPLAALDLKQGFGRLIRKKTDIGIAVLLDDRILKKDTLLKSFPPGVTIRLAEQAQICDALAELAQIVDVKEAPETGL
ncbi:MAG: Helicase c2, partial [Candidatus Uhrbacteria bacterium GW2011_GWC2_53_7]